MPRNLTASNKTDLARSRFVVEDLIEFYLPATTLYWTTGNNNITTTTPTSSPTSQSFVVNNGVKVVGDLKESFLLTVNEFTLILETFDSSATLLTGIDTNLNQCRLVVYKMFRDPDTNSPDSSNLINIFDGYATACSITGGLTSQVFQIQYRSIFNNFLGIKARTNSQLQPATNTSLDWPPNWA